MYFFISSLNSGFAHEISWEPTFLLQAPYKHTHTDTVDICGPYGKTTSVTWLKTRFCPEPLFLSLPTSFPLFAGSKRGAHRCHRGTTTRKSTATRLLFPAPLRPQTPTSETAVKPRVKSGMMLELEDAWSWGRIGGASLEVFLCPKG